MADTSDGDEAGVEKCVSPGERTVAGDSSIDPAVRTAIQRIHGRGERIRHQQVERARTELADELSDRELAVIETLGEQLLERLLAVPEAQLKTAAREGDDEQFERALELFG